MAESSDSPTGDPHIAQSEQAEIDAQRAAKAARLEAKRRRSATKRERRPPGAEE